MLALELWLGRRSYIGGLIVIFDRFDYLKNFLFAAVRSIDFDLSWEEWWNLLVYLYRACLYVVVAFFSVSWWRFALACASFDLLEIQLLERFAGIWWLLLHTVGFDEALEAGQRWINFVAWFILIFKEYVFKDVALGLLFEFCVVEDLEKVGFIWFLFLLKQLHVLNLLRKLLSWVMSLLWRCSRGRRR